VTGKWRSAPATDTPYDFTSNTFTVSPWDGIQVGDIRGEQDGSVSFAIDDKYPTSYTSVFPYIRTSGKTSGGDNVIHNDEYGRPFCTTCTFRAWATGGLVQTAKVTVVRADGRTESLTATKGADGRWTAPTNLYKGDTAYVEKGGVVDNYGEANGERSASVAGVRERPVPTKIATSLALLVRGTDSARRLGASLTELVNGSRRGIPGQKVDFFADGVFMGSGTTDRFGIVVFNPVRQYERAMAYEARYAGNDKYMASSSSPQ
jgi:hypothetical protein